MYEIPENWNEMSDEEKEAWVRRALADMQPADD